MRHQLLVLFTAVLVVSAVAPAAVSGATVGAAEATESTDTRLATDPVSDVTTVQSAQANCEYPIERTDATGETVTLEEAPDSVVTLYPGDAQLAFQIGAEDRVVGMPIGPYTDSLEAGDRTDISADDGVTPVTEEIVALEPDVVLAANITSDEQIEQLEEAGITVSVLETATSIDDVRENVAVTGEMTGECDGANETTEWMTERLEVVESALANESADEPLAYYPSDDQGTTPGADTFQHEVLTTSGLENVAERAGLEGWQSLSAEVVVEEDPEWIVYPDWADEPPIAESIEETTAYQEGNVVAVDDNAVSQPAPDIVYVVEHLVEEIHPDVYAEIEGDLAAVDESYDRDGGTADGSAESDENGDSADTTTDSDDTEADDTANDSDESNDSDGSNDTATAEDDTDDATDGDSGDSIPGFGVPAALGAILAGAKILTRRQ